MTDDSEECDHLQKWIEKSSCQSLERKRKLEDRRNERKAKAATHRRFLLSGIIALTAILTTQVSEKLHFSQLKCSSTWTRKLFKTVLKSECCLPWETKIPEMGNIQNMLENNLVGQPIVKKLLPEALVSGGRVHFFYGAAKTGKNHTAKLVADILLGAEGHASANFLRISVSSNVTEFEAGLDEFGAAYSRCPYQLLLLQNGQNLITAHARHLQEFAVRFPNSILCVLYETDDADTTTLLQSAALELFKMQYTEEALTSQSTLLKRVIRAKLYQNPELPYYRTNNLLDNLEIYPFLPLRASDLPQLAKLHNTCRTTTLKTPKVQSQIFLSSNDLEHFPSVFD